MLRSAYSSIRLALCGALLFGCAAGGGSSDLDAAMDGAGDADLDSPGLGDAAADAGDPDGGAEGGLDAATDAMLDGGAPDAMLDGAVPDATPIGTGRIVYPGGRTHSPLTEDLAAGLRSIAARGPSLDERIFAKVGDSITQPTSFLHCFGSGAGLVDLDGRLGLSVTVDHFRLGDAAGVDPFQRESLAVQSGWSASDPIAGAPSPLSQEVAAILPRYGVVMLGTNDVGSRIPDAFGADMLTIVDGLIAQGVVPILSTIPPRDDDLLIDASVPLFNLVVRGIAQGRGVPLIDYHRALLPLVGHGLGPDGMHPSTYLLSGFLRPCVLTPEGLAFGYNVRNLHTLEALDRARRALAAEAAPELEADVIRVPGEGTHAAPYEIPALPFTDLRDTRFGQRTHAVYDGCAAAQDESGPEIVYRLDLPLAGRLRAWVVDAGIVDIDLHLLDSSDATSGCLARGHREISADLAAGTYHLALDTFVDAAGTELAGEYVLVVLVE